MDCLDELQRLSDEFAQRAQATDQGKLVPREHLSAIGATGLYRWGVPRELGGMAVPFEASWRASEILAAGCGVTHFVSTQHQSSVSLLSRSPNQRLQEHCLEPLMSGERMCGVCFAHLRRPDPPAVTVRREGDHLVFNGVAPWFTGWGLMHDVFLAGVLPDGRFLSVLCEAQGPGLTPGPPMQLAVFTASATVSLTLENFRVEAWRELMVVDAAEMAIADIYGTLKNSAQPLGLVRAAVRLLTQAGFPGEPWLQEAVALRERAVAWQPGQKDEALAIRASANLLAVRAAQAGVVASGGAANSLDHPGQRLVREAMFYGLPQLTKDLKLAQIQALTNG